MTSFMRKQVAMGVFSASNVNQNFGYTYLDWPWTTTNWVRFWVDWTQLAPVGPNNPPTDQTPLPQGGTVAQYVQGIDNQIILARALNLNVMLTFFRCPQWANGVPSSYPNSNLYPPIDLSATSWWADYFLFCLTRWSALNPNNGGAYADVLEICNEPNIYPTDARGGGPPSPSIAGAMMVTAQTVRREFNITTPILAGPAVLDVAGATSKRIDCRDYVSAVMAYLSGNGFASGDVYFAWSTHNYSDIANQDTTLGQGMRTRLKSASPAWSGWPYADSSNPYVFQTEGGALFNLLGAGGQSNRMNTAYTNAHNDSAKFGQGLAMVTNYLDITDPNFDTGLRNTAYAPRQLYATWAQEPVP